MASPLPHGTPLTPRSEMLGMAGSSYCVRAFCDDYGCATKAGVPVDGYDIACGSIGIDELSPRLPRRSRKGGRS